MASDKAPALDVQKEDALDAPVHEVAPAAADRGVSQTSSGSISGLSAPAQPVQMCGSFWSRMFGPGSDNPVPKDYSEGKGNIW